MSSKSEDTTRQRRPGLLWDPEVDGLSTPAVPKESTSKEAKMAKDEPKVPEFDADKVEQLLNIVADLRDTSSLTSIRETAQMQLAVINRELWEELYPEQAEAEEKRLEEIRKMDEESRKAKEEEKAA